MRWGKRGAGEDIWHAFTLIGGVFVGIIFVLAVYRFSSNDRAESLFVAKDSALLADSILTAPGDVEVLYPKQYPTSFAKLNSSEFQIYSGFLATNATPTFSEQFIPSSMVMIDDSLTSLSSYYLVKQSGIVRIQNQPFDYNPLVSVPPSSGAGETTNTKTTGNGDTGQRSQRSSSLGSSGGK